MGDFSVLASFSVFKEKEAHGFISKPGCKAEVNASLADVTDEAAEVYSALQVRAKQAAGGFPFPEV